MAKTTKAKAKSARKPPMKGKFGGKFAGKPAGKGESKHKGRFKGKAPKVGARGRKAGTVPSTRRQEKAPRRSPAPAKRVAPATPPAPDSARPTAMAIAKAALDKKGEDVVVLDVRGLTSYADYFVVVTADSDRQASAIADHLEQTMKEQGVSKVGVEGYETGRWVLVDYGDVVAHVMNRESRGFYDLEGLWADAPRFAVEG
jgi:ribosome-associated protein